MHICDTWLGQILRAEFRDQDTRGTEAVNSIDVCSHLASYFATSKSDLLIVQQ
jgi:hypothetical protein